MATWMVGGAVALVVAAAIWAMVRDRRAGRKSCGCCGDCARCHGRCGD